MFFGRRKLVMRRRYRLNWFVQNIVAFVIVFCVQHTARYTYHTSSPDALTCEIDAQSDAHLSQARRPFSIWPSFISSSDPALEGDGCPSCDLKPVLPPAHAHDPKQLILIGVMTAEKYIDSRVIAAYETWVKTVPGRVIFFTSEKSRSKIPTGLPVVALPGVDDTYPPQKKSFLMFKFMHDFFRDKFQYFARVDDDIHVKGEELGRFLRSINSSQPLYMGQAGLGNREEFGKMGLNPNKPYCMGGPGMILNAATLKLFGPHIHECLPNMYTEHEDVEVGRCITAFSNATCTKSYEVRNSPPSPPSSLFLTTSCPSPPTPLFSEPLRISFFSRRHFYPDFCPYLRSNRP